MAIMNDIELSNQINKLQCLQAIIEEDLKNINKNVITISKYYKTNNTKKIEEVEMYQDSQAKIIINIFSKYQQIMKHNIEKTKQTAKDIEKMFEDGMSEIK